MAWKIEVVDQCAVVRMNTNKVNVQNDQFFADLHGAFDRLEHEFAELPVVLTGQGDVFSAGIDFQYSFDIFGSGSEDKIRDWYRAYRETNLRIFKYPRPTVAAVNGHAIAGGLITALDCDFRVAARKPAKFGLNEVPIGIPMPAAYVEIIKYTLGDQVGALATLRGKLYPWRTRRSSASSTRSSSPTAAAHRHRLCEVHLARLQHRLRHVEEGLAGQRAAADRRAHRRPDERIAAGMSDAGNRRAQDRRRQEIMKKEA